MGVCDEGITRQALGDIQGNTGDTNRNSIQAEADRLSDTKCRCVVAENGWMTERVFGMWINETLHREPAGTQETWLVGPWCLMAHFDKSGILLI
jgi:hypothetical protein